MPKFYSKSYNNSPNSGYVLTTDFNGLVSWTASTVLPVVYTVDVTNPLQVDASVYDAVIITAQNVAILIDDPIGVIPDCKPFYISLQDDGNAQTITYGSKFRAFGSVLPIVTVPGKVITYTMIYSAFYDKWDITWMLEI